MAKTVKPSIEESVFDYLNHLDHPLKDVVLELRKSIIKIDTAIGEQVKWNSLSFWYTGEMKVFDPKEYKRDIVVLNLHKRDQVLLVFPTGNIISDISGLLTGNLKDSRKIAIFKSMDDLRSKEKQLKSVIKNWLSQIE